MDTGGSLGQLEYCIRYIRAFQEIKQERDQNGFQYAKRRCLNAEALFWEGTELVKALQIKVRGEADKREIKVNLHQIWTDQVEKVTEALEELEASQLQALVLKENFSTWTPDKMATCPGRNTPEYSWRF